MGTTCKVLILGDAGVGKTSLRTQYFHKTFTFSYRATIGANFLTKNIVLPTPGPQSAGAASGEVERDAFGSTAEVSLCIWDTAGQERFNSLSPTFFRGSDCAILLYDVTHPQSLANLVNHHRDFLRYCGTRNPVVLVVGNKADAPRQVTMQQARRMVLREFGQGPDDTDGSGDGGGGGGGGGGGNDTTIHSTHDHAIGCFEVSAKLGTSVEDLFVEVATRIRARDQRRALMAFDVDGEEEGTHRFGLVDLKKKRRQAAAGYCAC